MDDSAAFTAGPPCYASATAVSAFSPSTPSHPRSWDSTQTLRLIKTNCARERFLLFGGGGGKVRLGQSCHMRTDTDQKERTLARPGKWGLPSYLHPK